ncbi:extracellular solute-binding protein [Albidovulum sp.]|uniref:extracellular solute-binding protein n=1 Tax=Albidovulum sp. TaxID=1872424 RepID=UPI001D768852|nr:extracellular solute-binding protein [Paracoccaceae bacterium]MCC0047322.1 extracellular solute-binding protein [Defluviimonas sp.]HRV63895.1 extracellular solute-binding protein [Albidovulum sp.]MCB2121963.1 extracellular solute-binding protein [Paracoccaceae bacterium]MCB2132019.1 extracellular solute-binding protein [Paracoccaceae bacterium]
MKKHLTAIAVLLGSAGMALAEGELQLFNWGDYTNPELIKKFEDETGIKVTITDYDSNDAALAKIEAGGHGFDLVVPSANYVQIYVEKGLVQELDLSKLSNHGNIAPQWMESSYDPGRKFSVPWQWGSTGVAVNKTAYSGDINTSAIFMDPPEELVGKVNVTPEMNDVLSLAIMYEGGEPCTEDTEILKKVRDALLEAKPKWQSMDYGMTEKMAANDVMASVYWNGAIFRARLQNPDVVYGYPKEGYPLWMDQVMLLSDANNTEEAYKFLDFIMVPENAALISSFARYANGITGSEAFMPEDMKDAPEINVPAEFAAAGHFLPTCSPKAQEYYTAIWTELQK